MCVHGSTWWTDMLTTALQRISLCDRVHTWFYIINGDTKPYTTKDCLYMIMYIHGSTWWVGVLTTPLQRIALCDHVCTWFHMMNRHANHCTAEECLVWQCVHMIPHYYIMLSNRPENSIRKTTTVYPIKMVLTHCIALYLVSRLNPVESVFYSIR